MANEDEKTRLLISIQKTIMDIQRSNAESRQSSADKRLGDALMEAAEIADKLVRDTPERSLVFLPEQLLDEMLVRTGALPSHADGLRIEQVRTMHKVVLRVGRRANILRELGPDGDVSAELVPSVHHAMQIARRMGGDVAPFTLLYVPEMILATLLMRRAVMLVTKFTDDPDYIEAHNTMDLAARLMVNAKGDSN